MCAKNDAPLAATVDPQQPGTIRGRRKRFKGKEWPKPFLLISIFSFTVA